MPTAGVVHLWMTNARRPLLGHGVGMAFRTSVCGHLAVDPPLNAAEFEFLTAFSASRRHAGRSHPYDVPGNPLTDSSLRVDDAGRIERSGHDPEVYNAPAVGQPALWCPWVPSRERSGASVSPGPCGHLRDGEG
jgi:hypothetical protein